MFPILILIFGFIGALIGKQKGRAGLGLAYGFLLGPLGCIIMVFVERDQGGPPFSVLGILTILAVLAAAVYFFQATAWERGFTPGAPPPPPNDTLAEATARQKPNLKTSPTPLPRLTQATPDPRQIAREIERKYGTHQP